MGQEKFEREFKIKNDSVAETAGDFIYKSGILGDKTKVDWYKEISQRGTSFEAKFKQSGKHYSVEFSEAGVLEDVEIEMDSDQIPGETMANMEMVLNSEFVKWKIKRVQRQWVGSELNIISSFEAGAAAEGVEENFEVIVKGRTPEDKNYFELLFSREGKLLRKSKIIENSSDILIY
ncbi:MAG: hypothetical protein WBG42_11530 [Cryomorphaceae bacterium]